MCKETKDYYKEFRQKPFHFGNYEVNVQIVIEKRDNGSLVKSQGCKLCMDCERDILREVVK
jgi:hypothetical protein